MENGTIIEKLFSLITPIVEDLNYELYHIEYVKENGEYYLRIYIDKPEGITLEDCEKVSRPVSDMLDEKDPISDSYYLEVSSPGVYRQLYNDKHLAKYINCPIEVKLNKAIDGKKVFLGTLEDFSSEEIAIKQNNEIINISRTKIKSIILQGQL